MIDPASVLRHCAALIAASLFALAMPLARASDVPATPVIDTAPSGPVHQLRIYEIFDDTKAHFHDRFRDHAARIMARHDFHIVAIWETKHEDRTEFVYLLEWPDEAAMQAGWADFMADEEWSAIKRRTRGLDIGRVVGDIEDRSLVLTDYSPQRRLLDPP